MAQKTTAHPKRRLVASAAFATYAAFHAAPDTYVGSGFDSFFGDEKYQSCVRETYDVNAARSDLSGPVRKALVSAAIRSLCWE